MSLALLTGVIALGGKGVITLSGEVVSDTVDDPFSASCSLRFGSDGNVYETEGVGGSEVQVDSGTDAIRPTALTAQHQIRFTNLTGAALASSTVAEDTWHPYSSGDFTLAQDRSSPGSNNSSFDVQIRYGTGPVRATGSYSLSATVN